MTSLPAEAITNCLQDWQTCIFSCRTALQQPRPKGLREQILCRAAIVR